MKKTLISIFLPTLRIGGAEKSLIVLANGLALGNWRIQLLVMEKEGVLLNDVSSDVEVVNLDCSLYRQAVLMLARYYDEYHPAIILTSLYATGLAAIVSKIIANHKPKIIVGAHNSLRDNSIKPDNWKDKFFLMPLCQLLFLRADGVIAVSKGLALEIQTLVARLPRDRIHSIYNPVVTQDILVKATEPVLHPWLADFGRRDFKTLISVGRLVEQKGFDILLEALVRTRESIDCRLIIVGDGPLQEELMQSSRRLGVEEFVDFAGWKENPYKYMAHADVFVLASRSEGLANVIVEALACGCPVVSTNCNYGPNEILEKGQYGALAEVDNPFDIASKIVQTLRVPDFYNSGKAKRIERSLSFTAESIVEQYESFFKEMMHK